MSKIRVSTSIAMIMAVLQVIFMHSSSWAAWSFELGQSFTFSKNSATIENLDRCKTFEGTQATTVWTKGHDVNYSLTPEIVWQNPDYHVFVLASGSYGWTFLGKQIGNALEYNTDGTTKGFGVEAGYIMTIDKRFNILPHFGFNWSLADARIKHQRDRNSNPVCFISQNGNRINTLNYNPFIGIEFDFITEVFNCKKIQISTLYDFGFLGAGHLRNTVPFTFITDSGATTRVASSTKLRDIISHTFEVEFVTEFAKQWRAALEFSYSITYNTHKLPLKFKHNRELVRQGQFTPTQYHVISQQTSQAIGVIFVLNYSIGTEGIFIR